jgi:hypothetical protein
MSSKLCDFLWQRCAAVPLTLNTDRAIPGMLLETEWCPWLLEFLNLAPKFLREDGFGWDLLKLGKGAFDTDLVGANIIQESINDKFSIGGKVDLPQYGLSVAASLATEFSAVFKVKGIRARVFKQSRALYDLYQALLAVKNLNGAMWDWVNDDMLIAESYYVTSFVAEFKSKGDLTAKAAFEEAGMKMNGEVDIKWTSDSTFEMAGTPDTPVAVRGLKV